MRGSGSACYWDDVHVLVSGFVDKGLVKASRRKSIVEKREDFFGFRGARNAVRSRAMLFGQKAAEEDAELTRLNSLTFRAKNFPVMVDRARMSGEYDRDQEKKCSDAAAAIRLRAATLRDGRPALDMSSTSSTSALN